MACFPENSTSAMKKILKIKSSDDQIFEIEESAAMLSKTLQKFAKDNYTSSEFLVVNINGVTLSKVITYLNRHADKGLSSEDKKRFDTEFLAGEEISALFKISCAAARLEVDDLFVTVSRKILEITRKSVKSLVRLTGVMDYSPSEEDLKIKEE